MGQLSGRVALVTGSTSGIGLGIACALAAEGADIAMNGFGTDAAITEACQAVEAFGGRITLSRANVREPDEVRQMVADAITTFGKIDILVNNAGIQHTAAIVDFPDDKWDAIIGINLSAAFHCTKAAAPGMIAAGWGRIINIASVHGLVGSANKSAYVAAKHGLVGFTKVSAMEFASAGVTVNAICPGWVLTPLVETQIQARANNSGRTAEAEQLVMLGEKQPMPAFTTREQIGAMAVYLCSEAARTITGVPMSIDGGWTAQ